MTGIETLIAACEWYPSQFFVVSPNVFSPLLYYTYAGSVIPTLVIGILLLLKARKNVEVQYLFLMTVFFSIWIFANLVTWATPVPAETMFFWSILILTEPFVYFFAACFIYCFLNKSYAPLRFLIPLSLPLIPTILLTPTMLGLTSYDLSNCDRAANEGPLALYGYIIELLYVICIIVMTAWYVIKERNADNKKRAFYVSLGTTAFLLSFSLGNITEVFTENWYIGQYGLLGAPIFTALLAYVIVRFRAFNIRLIGAQALIAGVWLLVFSLLFIRTIENARYAIISTLVLLFFLGGLLIRSVKNEIKSRERNELLAKDLAKANARLRELDRQKSEFVSIASHQLRSPLTAIRGYASMLLEGSYGKVPKKAEEVIGRIQESSGYMASSIEDFLNVSRIEQGRMKYELAKTDISLMAGKVVEEMKASAAKKGVLLEFRGSQSVIANIDPGKMRQVIYNLVDNALKYTPQGRIEVAVDKNPSAQIAAITVTDTGVGMSVETQAAIFDKFVRAKNANSVNVSGTGLGLYVAKQMIEAMQGRISATSKGEGKGSTFKVIIPLAS